MLGTGDAILEAKYDGIKYEQSNSSFYVLTNQKTGMISTEGKTLIKPEYESLLLIDSKNRLYLAKKNNLYGVINETGKEIIYIENEKIGIDVSNFSYNGVKNGYILLDKLIPVMQNKKWAFYDLKGNMVSNGYIYDAIGCSAGNTSNVYGLLIVPDYDMIVVQKDKKYSLMTENGEENILPFSFDSMYIKVSSGKEYYYMQYNGKNYDIVGTLEKKGVSKKSDAEKD